MEEESTSRKINKVKEMHIPKADNVRNDINAKLIINWIDKIEAAKGDCKTNCYVVSGSSRVTRYVVQRFLNAGYDLYYEHYIDTGLWFIRVHWGDGCRGRIYNIKNRLYVSIDEMFIY